MSPRWWRRFFGGITRKQLLGVAVVLALLCLCLFLNTGCSSRVTTPPVAKPPVAGSDLSSVLLWAAALSILGIGASVAALVWLPTKKLAIAGIAGFGTMLGVALTVKALQPYLLWIGLVVIAAFAVAVFLVIRKQGLASSMAVLFGLDMTKAETDAQAEQVKATHAALQEALGVRGLIDRLLQRAKQSGSSAARTIDAMGTKPPG